MQDQWFEPKSSDIETCSFKSGAKTSAEDDLEVDNGRQILTNQKNTSQQLLSYGPWLPNNHCKREREGRRLVYIQ